MSSWVSKVKVITRPNWNPTRCAGRCRVGVELGKLSRPKKDPELGLRPWPNSRPNSSTYPITLPEESCQVQRHFPPWSPLPSARYPDPSVVAPSAAASGWLSHHVRRPLLLTIATTWQWRWNILDRSAMPRPRSSLVPRKWRWRDALRSGEIKFVQIVSMISLDMVFSRVVKEAGET